MSYLDNSTVAGNRGQIESIEIEYHVDDLYLKA